MSKDYEACDTLDLFEWLPPEPAFEGYTFEHAFDVDRLQKQLRRVFEVMKDGGWRTLSEISEITQDGEASVSARLRDFRKDRFPGFRVFRRRRGPAERGLFEYQLMRQGAVRG